MRYARGFLDLVLAVVAVLILAATLFGQELQIKGAGVRQVTVVESLPFTIEAPKDAPKGAALFGHTWEYKRESITATARGNVLEITAAPKGTIVVFCKWWVVDFGAQKVEEKTAFVTFSVGDIGPGPKPPDIPPPAGRAAHLSFIGPNAATADVVADTGLRAYMQANGVKVHVLTANDPQIETSKLTAAVAKAGGTPCLVIQDASGHVLDQAKITTVEAVKTKLKPFVGK